jgi:hypothetical protein
VHRNISVAVWPFDGLSVTDAGYSDAHVIIEPYPSAVRGAAQSDDSDATASADHVREADLAGTLPGLLDLSSLDAAQAATVAIEGWIVSHNAAEHR